MKQAELEEKIEEFGERFPEVKVPCTCPKGGINEDGEVCERCGGTQWVIRKDVQEWLFSVLTPQMRGDIEEYDRPDVETEWGELSLTGTAQIAKSIIYFVDRFAPLLEKYLEAQNKMKEGEHK